MENSLNRRKFIFMILLVNFLFPLVFVQLAQSLLQIYNPALEGGILLRLIRSFKPTILALFLVALGIACFALYRILSPLKNYIVKGTDYEKARRATLSVPWALLAVHGSLWVLANVAFYMAYNWETPGGVPFFWSLSLNVLAGLLGALFSTLSMNVLFIPVKSLLHISSRNAGEEDYFIQNKNLIIMGVLILSAVLFTAYAGRFYSVSDQPNGLSYSGSLVLLVTIFLTVSLWLIQLSRMEDKKQLKQLTGKLRELNRDGGNLAGSLVLINFDSTGEIVEEINHLMEKLHGAFTEVAEAAGDMLIISEEIDRSIESARDKTGEILNSSREVNVFLNEQKDVVNQTGRKLGEMLQGFGRISALMEEHRAAVDTTSTTIEEMTANIKSVSDNTARSREITDKLSLTIREGSSAVNSSISSIEEIHSTAEEMNTLVHIIGKVAAQTNMLAMNAAIEAAHAGDKGLGFAVVADEVRKLAGSSSANTGEISGNIQELNQKVEQGVSTTRAAGVILEQIMAEIQQSSLLSGEIASAMTQQKSGTEELLNVVYNVVSTSNTIQGETARQVKDNSRLKENIQGFMDQCARIQEITNSQLDSNTLIYNSLESLKKLSEKGKQLGGNLETVISGFSL